MVNLVRLLKRSVTYDVGTTLPDVVPYNIFVLYDDIFGRRGGTFQSSHSGFLEHCQLQQLIRPGVETPEKLRDIAMGRGFSGTEILA